MAPAPLTARARSRAPALLCLACLLPLAGCGHPHPAPDAQLVADLRQAIARALPALGQPALSGKDLDDQAVQLAWATDPGRIGGLRSGALPRERLLAEARQVPALITQRRAGQAPGMLTWLLEHGATLDLPDQELLEAVRAQAMLELAQAQQ
jgi:hypothetical protein